MKPTTLIILDGWGVAPSSKGNAITLAKTPNFDQYLQKYPHFTLQAAGEAVGLSWGEIGNSEVGHLNLGAGKIIYQNLPRITQAIWNKTFFSNPAFIKAIEHVKKNNSNLHLLGLVSNGGVHSFNEHLYALLELARNKKLALSLSKGNKVFIHAILDGRDAPYNSGYNFITQLEEVIASAKIGQIATLFGRFYAMDRDLHWERTEKAYQAMVLGEGQKTSLKPSAFIQEFYKKKIYDEEMPPTVFTNEGKIKDDDAVIFFNFRADRTRQITKAFVLPGFEKFLRPRLLQNLFFVSFTEYEKDLPVEIAFPSEKIDFPLARILSEKKLNQLHIAETEKYAHLTYFFNGRKEESFEGEDDVLIPSPRVASYALIPEMSASKIAKKVIQEIANDKYDFILINFANPDMVGHTGNLEASKKAVEVVDKCLGKIVEAILFKGGTALITADHGNAEELINLQTGEIDKEHSTNPVPFIVVGKEWAWEERREVLDLSLVTPAGVLADVAPTVLRIIGIEQPGEITGRSLI
jgi:2,3-bisphosphoglycerate-independent phosphoglycerate mutase